MNEEKQKSISYKIFTEEKKNSETEINSQIFYGIKNTVSNEIIVETLFSKIEKINNYSNLAFNEYSNIYKLYINLNECHFCIINGDKAKISKHIYDAAELLYFFKSKTICTIKNEFYVIDIDETFYKGPLNEDELNEMYMYLDEEYRDLINVNITFKERNGLNYGHYKKEDLLENGEEYITFLRNDITGSSAEMVFDNLSRKDASGFKHQFDISNFISQGYHQVNDFDYSNGTCLVKFNNQYSLINRYFFQISPSFDYVLESLTKNENSKDIFWIVRGDDMMKIKLKGNFIADYFNKPYLFFKYDLTLEYVAGIKRPIIDNENNYWKTDEALLDQYLNDMRQDNPDVEVSNELIQSILNSDDYLSTLYENLPFDIREINLNLKDIEKHLEYHNSLMGNIYSTYEVLEKRKLSASS